jgi:hypothetical protein
MNNALTTDDLEDLDAVARNTSSDTGRMLRRSMLDDGGKRLESLGLIEERVPAVYGIPGSARMGVTGAGLDELFERGL